MAQVRSAVTPAGLVLAAQQAAQPAGAGQAGGQAIAEQRVAGGLLGRRDERPDPGHLFRVGQPGGCPAARPERQERVVVSTRPGAGIGLGGQRVHAELGHAQGGHRHGHRPGPGGPGLEHAGQRVQRPGHRQVHRQLPGFVAGQLAAVAERDAGGPQLDRHGGLRGSGAITHRAGHGDPFARPGHLRADRSDGDRYLRRGTGRRSGGGRADRERPRGQRHDASGRGQSAGPAAGRWALTRHAGNGIAVPWVLLQVQGFRISPGLC